MPRIILLSMFDLSFTHILVFYSDKNNSYINNVLVRKKEYLTESLTRSLGYLANITFFFFGNRHGTSKHALIKVISDEKKAKK